MTREEAIDLLDNLKGMIEDSQGNNYDEAFRMAIEALKQEPKTGNWIETEYVGNDNYNFECSECHHTDTHSKAVKVNYCWYCGADMREGD